MRRKLLLFNLLLFTVSIVFGQTTCSPDAANYNTGSTDGSSFTETSLIHAVSNDAERGWARFNTSAIPDGNDISSVELHIYVSYDNYAYFKVMSMENDPLLGSAASVFTDCGDGTTYSTYSSNFPDPGWYVVDLGSIAAIDLQNLLNDDWFGVGLYEYESFGGYYLEYDGWNETNAPYIVVTHAPPPACPDPSAQTESNITTSGADLGWTEASGSHWDIYVVATGGAAPSQDTIPTANDVTANPYTWAGGSAAITYDWYVRSDCDQDNTGTSAWVGPSTFTTNCNATTTFPFTELFEGTVPPICWSEVRTPSSSYGWSSNSSGFTGKCARFDSYYNSSGNISELITTTLDLSSLTTAELVFYYKNPTGGDFSVLLSTDGGATYPNTIASNLTGETGWTGFSINISAYIGSNVKIEFKGTSNYGNGDAFIYLDNVSVGEVSTCPSPTALTVSDLTTTTAKLTWNSASGVTGYNWEVVPLGNGQGNGVVASGSISDTSAVATGLSVATTYDAYVQSDCGSSYDGPVTFVTECLAKVTTFPYTTDFDNAGLIPNCWTNDAADAGGDWEFVTDNSHGPTADHTTGSGYYALLDDFGIHSSDSPFNLLTPVFDLSTADKWYKVSYWAWIGPDGADNPIYFEVSLDGGTTWKTLYTHDHSNTETWFKTEIELGFNKSANVVFRFRGMSIYWWNTDNSGIDDFTIEETQAPPVPLSDWAVYAVVFFILSFLVIRFKRRLA